MPNNDHTPILVEIPFHNQVIPAYQNKDGEAHVALKPICENMGIDFNGQYQRLKRVEWTTMCMTHTVGADGKIRDMVAIDRQTFTMWLATIDTSRIKNETAKHLVILYQREAAKALDAYFNEGGAIRVREEDTDADIMARALVIANKTLERREQRIREMETKVAELEPKAQALDVFTAVKGSYSVADAAKILSNDLNITIGRNRLYGFMDEINWVYRDPSTRNWCAYQPQIENGRLEMKAHTEHGVHKDGSTFPFPPTVRITAKGLADLRGRLLAGSARKEALDAQA